MPEPSQSLTPDQLAGLDQSHDEGQRALDELVEEHRVEVARHGELVATARLTLEMMDQSHDVAAGFAAHAVTRLVQDTDGPARRGRDGLASEPTEALDLAALSALEAAATPAPWHLVRDGQDLRLESVVEGDEIATWTYLEGDWAECDTRDPDLIVAARNALPGLLAEVKRLTAELARLGMLHAQAAGERDVLTAELTDAQRCGAAWMEEATRQATERDREYRRAEARATALVQVTGERDDALQVVADPAVDDLPCGTTTDSPLIGHAPLACELTAGHAGWHRTSDGSTFTERAAAGVGEPRTPATPTEGNL
jgi:hypothetical protein